MADVRYRRAAGVLLAAVCLGFAHAGQAPPKKFQALVGDWVQYGKDERNQKWVRLGAFAISTRDDQLHIVDTGKIAIPQGGTKTKGIFRAEVEDDLWTFYSDWGGGTLGFFKLLKVDDDTYEGHVYVNNVKREQNIWRRAKR